MLVSRNTGPATWPRGAHGASPARGSPPGAGPLVWGRGSASHCPDLSSPGWRRRVLGPPGAPARPVVWRRGHCLFRKRMRSELKSSRIIPVLARSRGNFAHAAASSPQVSFKCHFVQFFLTFEGASESRCLQASQAERSGPTVAGLATFYAAQPSPDTNWVCLDFMFWENLSRWVHTCTRHQTPNSCVPKTGHRPACSLLL